jgi:hypothetical protein
MIMNRIFFLRLPASPLQSAPPVERFLNDVKIRAGGDGEASGSV